MSNYHRLQVMVNSENQVALYFEDSVGDFGDVTLILREGQWVRRDWDFNHPDSKGEPTEVITPINLGAVLRAIAQH